MFEFFRSLVPIIAPVFVVSTMLNVGLTQKLSDITRHLNNYPFVLKMLLANFVLAPFLMIFVLTFTSFDPAIRDGLLIFALCAGAPFLIKLTQTAERDVALGAAVMILLIARTAIYVPIVLPMVMYEVAVDGWAIAKTLLLQMLLPIAAGIARLQALWNQLQILLGLELDIGDVNGLQIALRTIIIYAFTLAIIRLGSKRFLGRASPFDLVVGIMLGSVMSRAINGSTPFFPTLLGGIVLIGMHWLIAVLAYHIDWFGPFVKENAVLLIKDGEM